MNTLRWVFSRVLVIYIIVFLFCLTCIDFKTLSMRIKVRHLNDAIPDFSDMIIFSRDQNAKIEVDWKPYKYYFDLILRYVPDDVITKQLLGYVDYYSGRKQAAIDLFKSSTDFNGQSLFWSNYDLGVLYYKEGMWPQAALYLFKAIQSNSKLTVVLMQDSIIYKQIFINPDFKYSLIDEINDAQSHAYILLLSSLHYLRQYDKMVMISNLGLSNQNLPHKDAFYYYAGLGFYEGGQLEKAYLFFQKSLSLEKNNPDLYYYLASIYQNAGKLQEARDLLQVSYTLHQKNDPRFPYDAHVNLRFF